jgi:hypothetical protein
MGDGWNEEEGSVNKLGSTIVIVVAIAAALLAWGVLGIEIPPAVLWIAVAVAGLVGGAMNIAGRGPIPAGALIGLVIGLGGFGAVWWFVTGRASVRMWQVGLAFIVGAAPGFILQLVIQQVLKKRAEA